MGQLKASNWLIYALGGGWGHLTRSLALARIAANQVPVTILTNSEYAPFVVPDTAHVQIERLSPHWPRSAIVAAIQQRLRCADASCLIVDSFPRGLGGELVDLLTQRQGQPTILVHRDLNPAYVSAHHLAAFVRTAFDRVLIPGDGSPTPEVGEQGLPLATLPQSCYTAPWLLRTAEELPDRALACSHLGLENLTPETPVILVITAGQQPELSWYGAVTVALAQAFPQAIVRCLAPVCPPHCPPRLWRFHWPAIDCLPAADVVVGGAGYNTFYECQSLGIPLVARPCPRLYDRQQARIDRWWQQPNAGDWWVRSVSTVEAAIAAVAQALHQAPQHSGSPSYVNGAIEAVQLIQAVVQRHG